MADRQRDGGIEGVNEWMNRQGDGERDECLGINMHNK